MLWLNLDLVDQYARYMYLVHEHSTARRYVWEMKKAVAFLSETFKGAPPVEAIGKEHLLAFLMDTAKRSDRPARAAWNNRLRPLRSFWGYLNDAELIEVNPAQRIKPAKVRSDRRLSLTISEFLALFEAIESSSAHYRTRNEAMIMVLFFCGLRVSELMRLKLTNIDWVNSALINIRVKGGKHLDLHFPKIVSDALRACVDGRPQFNPALDEQACFLSDRGVPMSVRQFQGLLRRYGKLAGILRPVSPHVVRHTSATELAREGLSLFGLKDFLGHESIVATQRYIHLTDEIKQAVELMSVRFSAMRAEHRHRRDESAVR